MKTLFRFLAVISALAFGILAYAGDAKKEATPKDDDCCKECCKDGSCEKCKAEKAGQDAKKSDEKKPEKK